MPRPRGSLSIRVAAAAAGALLVLVALPSVARATPPAGNVVANPGFETGCAGAPCNWSPTDAGVTTFATSADAHSGAASLYVVGNTLRGGESDCITGLSDGDVLSLSYWIKGVSIVTSGGGIASYFSDSSCGTSNGNFLLTGGSAVTIGTWAQIQVGGGSGPFNGAVPAGTRSIRVAVIMGCGGPCSALFDDVSVTVNGVPTADAGPDQAVNSAAPVTLDGTGSSDPQAQALTYSWTQSAGPAVTLTGANTAQPTFTAPAGPATLSFDLQVCDGGAPVLCDTDTVSVAVNGPPTADAGPDQTVNQGVTVTMDGTGSSDPDMDPLTYSWTQTGGPAVTLTGANTAQPTFTAPAGPATLTFDLTVCDDAATPSCDTDTVTVTVRPPIGPPPPPPPPTLVCGGLDVTVNLALGQSPTNGPDVIRGTDGADIINGLGGDDVICGGGGLDIVSGNQGDDRLFGGGGDDEMRGNAGDDILRGRAGDDLLYGQALNDTLDGGADTDTCRGGTGVDTATACETTVGVP